MLDREPCAWCGDTGRVHAGLGPPIRCRSCAPSVGDLAIDLAAKVVGAAVALVVMGGGWGLLVRAVERGDRATRGWLDPAVDALTRKRGG